MKKIKFSKTFSFILLFTLFLIFLSYYVNRSTEETLENISYTYILGLYFFWLGTCPYFSSHRKLFLYVSFPLLYVRIS